MKTVTIKLRIHKLLAEKRLTKYRFIAMTGLGYKNASRILDNETESIRFSTIHRPHLLRTGLYARRSI